MFVDVTYSTDFIYNYIDAKDESDLLTTYNCNPLPVLHDVFGVSADNATIEGNRYRWGWTGSEYLVLTDNGNETWILAKTSTVD